MSKKFVVYAWSVAALGLVACGDSGPETVKGGTDTVYGSKLEAYAIVDGDTVKEVGFTLPQAAAAMAMAQPAGTVDGWHADFPPEVADKTVVNHLLLDMFRDGIVMPWNHAYFGVHFHFKTQAERVAIACPETGMTVADADTMPTSYIALDGCTFGTGATCGCVAGEGVHLIDSAAPEMQNPPGAFTHNMWIGFHSGVQAFFEPFVTVETLMGSADYSDVIRQPAKYPAGTSGKLYPGKLTATLKDGTWTIALVDWKTIP
jgi:hypothetical protein